MSAETITQLFARREEARAMRDIAALMETYADDCVVETQMWGTLRGRQAVERADRDMLAAIPDIAYEAEKLMFAGTQAVQSAIVTGTDSAGMLTSPGAPLRFPVVVLYTIENGRVALERRIWDFSSFLLQRVQHDLRVAAEIQQMLLPQGAVVGAGFEAAAASIPCRTLGGDFFDYFDLANGGFALVLGDIAGKGPPAAILSAALQAFISASPQSDGPAAVLGKANRAMLRRAVPRFATVVYAALSTDGRLTYSNAGHNPPLVIGRSGRRWLRQGGTVLGVFDGIEYEEATLQLDESDRLVVYSDGVTEALNTAGVEFGEDRLASCVADNLDLPPAAMVQRILDTVRTFAAGTRQGDDLTALVLSRAAGTTTAG
jgi:ketosteroid isomerase-like protein